MNLENPRGSTTTSTDPGTLSDEALMARLALGETGVLSLLVSRNRRRVFAVLLRATGRRDDAEDLFQETWIRVARRAVTFDPARPFSPWIAGIATHLAIDWMRSSATRSARAAPWSSKEIETVPHRVPEPVPDEDARRAEMASALASLPEQLREAVLLRYFDELSEKEMAEKLDVPPGTVKSRLHHALRALRNTLSKEDRP